jgi:predicted tellurium resistance membrane protein TerC
MSLDNVLAIAAAAKGHPWLIGFGLLVSIPLIVAGATLIMALLSRFPILVWAGAGLLGWIAGELLMEDPVSRPYFDQFGLDYGLDHKAAEIAMQVACTLFVLLCGWLLMKWQNRAGRQTAEHKSAAE